MDAPRCTAGPVVALLLAMALPLGAGCSSGGSGGATGSGGVSSSGGSPSSSGGSTATGGVSGSGGVGSGGATTTSSGGSTATGGATSSGGAPATGGTNGSGGVTSSGGTTSAGGAGGMGTAGRNGGAGNGGRAGGGGDGRGGSKGGGGGAGLPASITLTSPVVTEGAAFPAMITCADPNMASPELDWTAGPSGTMSYAVTLTDLTNSLVHWAIWNIPSTVMSLPAALATTATLTTPAGARQLSYNGTGYAGPCPGGTPAHTYEFRVYAVSVAALPGNNPTMTSAAKTAIVQNALATGALTGTSDAKKM